MTHLMRFVTEPTVKKEKVESSAAAKKGNPHVGLIECNLSIPWCNKAKSVSSLRRLRVSTDPAGNEKKAAAAKKGEV